MHRVRYIGPALALLLLTAACDDDPAGPDGELFVVQMTGAAERPGPGDPNGTGTARITLREAEVCFELTVANIQLPATGAHIHVGDATTSGAVVVPLTAPGASGTSSGCVAADVALIATILQTPANYYVNVHTAEFPAGAVRGQLTS